MGIKTVEDAIIEQIKAVLMVAGNEKLRQVDSLPGDWDADMLKRLLRLAPGVFVAFMGGPVVAGNTAQLKAQWAVIAITGHASGEAARRRGDNLQIGAYEIVEAIVPKLHGFKIDDEGTLKILDVSNLYNGELDKQGVTVYAMRFEILMGLPSNLDLAALDSFETFSAKYDLAPMERYLLLPGVIGSRASTPDAPANRIAGDLDIRVLGALDDFTPAAEQALISKMGGAVTDAYRLALLPSGVLRFSYSTDGANAFNRDSTVAVPFANFTRHAWRCTVDVDNGAAGHEVKFWTSDDYDPDTGLGTWAQLGAAVVNAGVIAMFAGSSPLAIGADSDGQLPAAAKIYRAQLFAGINGVLAVDFNPDDTKPDAASFASAVTKEVWTMNGTAKIDHAVEAEDTVTLPQS